MFQYGIGLRNIFIKSCHQKENRSHRVCYRWGDVNQGWFTDYIWVWVALESKNRESLRTISISKERKICLLQNTLFINRCQRLWKTSCINRGGGTWYPYQACRFLNLEHHAYSSYEKSIVIERTMQYIKDRTEFFDDYFPCRMKNCILKHVINWMNLFEIIITADWRSLSEQSRFMKLSLNKI